MNLLCQLFLCYTSILVVSSEEKNHLLILEQMITQIATNREAIKGDRNAINKLLYDNDRLTADVLNLENKILDLEKELKRYLKPPPTEEEVTAALIDKLTTKLVKYTIRECGASKSLCLITVFKNPNINTQQMAFDASVRSKLLKHRGLNVHEAERLQELARGDLEIVLDNFKTDAVIFLIIEDDIEDSFMDLWAKELTGNVVVPPSVQSQKIKQAPALAPVRAHAPAPAPRTQGAVRLFKR